jgi:hypothetical protein
MSNIDAHVAAQQGDSLFYSTRARTVEIVRASSVSIEMGLQLARAVDQLAVNKGEGEYFTLLHQDHSRTT